MDADRIKEIWAGKRDGPGEEVIKPVKRRELFRMNMIASETLVYMLESAMNWLRDGMIKSLEISDLTKVFQLTTPGILHPCKISKTSLQLSSVS